MPIHNQLLRLLYPFSFLALRSDYECLATGYDSRFSVYKPNTITSMNQFQSRRVNAGKLREMLNDFADQICNAQERITIALSGNTFEIHLDGGTINITINEPLTTEGGEL